MCVRYNRIFSAADSTGTHSLYTTYKDFELMFHVSTMLPYTPNNRQQVSWTHFIVNAFFSFSLLIFMIQAHVTFLDWT